MGVLAIRVQINVSQNKRGCEPHFFIEINIYCFSCIVQLLLSTFYSNSISINIIVICTYKNHIFLTILAVFLSSLK